MPDQELSDHGLMEQLDQAIESVLAAAEEPPVSDLSLAPLVNIAAALRHFPAEGFKERLKRDLERKALVTTSTQPTGTSAPAGFRTITPFIIHARAPELVEFMKTTLGAEELKRNTGGVPDGFYSEMRIGDTILMIAGGSAARRGNLPSALHVYVNDCDAAYRRALDAGAITLYGSLGEPADRPYGERSAFVEDAFGNYWYIATRPADAPTVRASVLAHVHPQKARPYIDFLTRAFGAESTQIVEQGGSVMHAEVRLGDAMLEMGEPGDRTGIPTNGLFFFVDDVDAAYARALAAGATAIRPPDNTPAEMRSAIVRDPEGYLWWPAKRL